MNTMIPPKDPGATLDYLMDWSAWLAAGETIQGTPVVTADTGLDVNPGGRSTSVAAGKVTFWLGGGLNNKAYAVACQITTSQGRTDQRSFQLVVSDR